MSRSLHSHSRPDLMMMMMMGPSSLKLPSQGVHILVHTYVYNFQCKADLADSNKSGLNCVLQITATCIFHIEQKMDEQLDRIPSE